MSDREDAAGPLVVGLRMHGRPALVVGGGSVATRRGARLAAAGAMVTVVAPEATASLRELASEWRARRYESSDVVGMTLVVAATGDPEVDARVVADSEAVGAWVNHTGDWSSGSVLVPAAVEADGVTIAVSTGGQSPVLARWLADEIERDLLPMARQAAAIMGLLRRELVAAGRPASDDGWKSAIADGLFDLIREGDLDSAENLLRRHLGLG